MRTRPQDFADFALSTLCLILVAPLAAADPVSQTSSPYRINAETVTNTRPAAPLVATQQVVTAQSAYQLETEYQQHSPKQVKAQLATPGLQASWTNNQLILGKYSDYSMTNPKLTDQPFSEEIAQAARAASLDPALVHAVIFVESHYRHSAISPKGAIGLMQVLPDTAARYGIKDVSHSRSANLKAGTLYLRDLMRMFDNRIDLALAAYNAGEGSVVKYAWQVPPYHETRQYVLAVMTKYNEWRGVKTTDSVVYGHEVEANQALPIKPVATASGDYLTGTRLAISYEMYSYK